MAKKRKKSSAKVSPPRKRSNKGALLKGMSRRLPIELLGDVAFEEGLQKIMRGYAGVYALYDNEKLYYVGLATNLYSRLRWHTKNRHKEKWNLFAIFRVNRVRLLKDIETLLLQVSKPPGNTLSGRLHRDADLTRVIQKVHRDSIRRLNKLKKALR